MFEINSLILATMKKSLFIIVIITIFFTNLVKGQANWGTYKIDSRVSVKFPSKPEQTDDENFISASPDSAVVVSVMVLDFKKIANADSTQLAEMVKAPDFLQQFKGFLESRLSNIKFDDFKEGSWNNLKTFETQAIQSNTVNKYHYLKFVLLGYTIYGMYVISTSTSNNNLKTRDDFFSSFLSNK